MVEAYIDETKRELKARIKVPRRDTESGETEKSFIPEKVWEKIAQQNIGYNKNYYKETKLVQKKILEGSNYFEK